jgi:lactoylglutathione lyase
MGLRKSTIVVATLGCVSVACAGTTPVPDQPPPRETTTMSAPLPRIGFVSFYVLDLQRSLDFYIGKLGMREQGRIPLPNGLVEILLGFGPISETPGVILMFDPKRTTSYALGDGFSRFVIRVAELRPLVKRLSEGGVVIVVPPTAVDALKLTYSLIRDPDGYMIEFIQNE